MKKPVDFAAGLAAKLQPALPITEPEAETLVEETPRSKRAPSREKKVVIAAYFEPEVRKQFALLSVMEDSTQSAMLAEALNLLFEKYGKPPIAKA
ncbi:ribbon-helix-helix domain-containing protein [Methylobacterium oryzae]|uniref:ribbon-helix-helix domain-containing protein n=1 Tax=Methylobacterium oryzae TaxID=334852 RepID=UPI002F3432D1